MVDPIAVGAATVVAVAAGLAAYRRIVNGGEDEYQAPFTTEEDSEETTNPVAEDETPYVTPTPERVTEKDELTDVKGIGPTRAEALGGGGYSHPRDLYYSTDENLLDVHGIGPLTVSQIREDIGSVDDEVDQ